MRRFTPCLMRGLFRAGALLCLLFGLGGIAAAQHNLYGTMTCTAMAAAPNPDPPPARSGAKPGPASQARPAQPQADPQQHCVWPEPILLMDIGSRDAQGTLHSQVTGTKSQDTGQLLIHMNNGEQVTMKLAGSSVLGTDGTLRSRQGNWTITDGTGVFKGIIGNGMYTGQPRASGGVTFDLQGAYQLPADMEKPPAPLATPPMQLMPGGASPDGEPTQPNSRPQPKQEG
jgi:hypothetical protein